MAHLFQLFDYEKIKRQGLRSIVTFAVLLGSFALEAAPYIDPMLQQSTVSASRTPVRMILVFKDSYYIPNLRTGNRTSYDTRYAMIQNARQSQKRVFQQMTSSVQSGTPLKASQIWLSNTAIVEAPASYIQNLARYEEISAILADRPISLIQSVEKPMMSVRAEGNSTEGLKKIMIPELRAKFPLLTGRGIKVGILDTGIDPNHPDLVGRTLIFKDFVQKKPGAYDDNRHGTHVAGTISGGNKSGLSIGVAPEAQLVVGKILDGRGSGSMSNILMAMQWITDPDGKPETADFPRVVSNSWGGGGPSGDPANDQFCKAVEGWVKIGMIPVFANGNSGPSAGTVSLPAGCPAAFAVGATDFSDRIASFSSRGPARWGARILIKPEVSAPGVDVQSSVPGGGYARFSGTSMATPHVAGLFALIFQARPELDLVSAERTIITGVDELQRGGQNNIFGFGRVNALKTVTALQKINSSSVSP